MVDLGLVGDVERVLFEHLLFELSHAKAHAADRAGVVGDGELEVITFGADASGGAGQANALGGKDGFGIALPEGAQQFELLNRFARELAQRRDRVDAQLGDGIGLVQVLRGVSLEGLGEVGESKKRSTATRASQNMRSYDPPSRIARSRKQPQHNHRGRQRHTDPW